jgi:RNA polymerase sigma-70 factor (ECF subfamily)
VRDQLRRASSFAKKKDAVEAVVVESAGGQGEEPRALLKAEIADDELRMIFVACHPANTLESQIALTLRTLSGMEIGEIARALLCDEAAVEKRLVRARQRLREADVSFELPAPAELAARLDAVIKVLYLLFNEGYSATRGDAPVRADLTSEAIRLTAALLDFPTTARPDVQALMALFLFQSSRFAARVGEGGSLLTLEEQDRSKWDAPRIQAGLMHLARSASGDRVTEVHLEAAIAACHATARTYAETDWPRIAAIYDDLAAQFPSPVVAVNRAVAIGRARGAEAGLAELRALEGDPKLASYHWLAAAIGQFSFELGRVDDARQAFRRALSLAGTEPERAFLTARLAACG